MIKTAKIEVERQRAFDDDVADGQRPQEADQKEKLEGQTVSISQTR